MRLIDATKLEDLLRRQMEMDWNKQAAPASWSAAYEQILEELGETPVVDAVPVVRCRECEHGEYDDAIEDEYCYHCRYDGFSYNKADHFCSDGERKGGDEDERSKELS